MDDGGSGHGRTGRGTGHDTDGEERTWTDGEERDVNSGEERT